MKDLLLKKSKLKKHSKPKYFYPIIMTFQNTENNMKKWRYTLVKDKIVNENLQKVLQRISRKFETDGNVNIPQVALFKIDSRKEAFHLPYAAYDGKNSTIIVNMEMAKRIDEEFLITHEMFHHFVCRKSNKYCNGFLYVYKNYLFGGMLDEGFTNFLTEILCKKREKVVYVFPTLVARLVASIIGVKAASQLYISSEISILKEDFNKKLSKYYKTEEYEIENQKGLILKLTPFEVFCGTLEYIGLFWHKSGKYYEEKRKNAMKCVIEMLNYYALQTDTTDYIKYRQEQENFFKEYKI